MRSRGDSLHDVGVTSHGLASPRARSLDRYDWTMATVALAAVALILVLGRGSTFFFDEQDYLVGRSLGDPASWLRPHNEHIVVLHVIAYRLIVELFGTGSYLPFMLALMATHVLVALGVYRLVRDAVGPHLALAFATITLLLGTAFENLYWAFQMGFVGATALGIWSLVAIQAGKNRLALALLTAGILTQAVALWWCVAAAVLSRRWYMLLPAIAYGTWLLASGQSNPAPGVVVLAGFVTEGLLRLVLCTFGLAIPIVAFGIWHRGARHLPPLTLAAGYGLLAMFVILGFGRAATFGEMGGTAPRYIGAAAPLLLIGSAGMFRTDPSARWSAAVVAGSMVVNVPYLVAGAMLFGHYAIGPVAWPG